MVVGLWRGVKGSIAQLVDGTSFACACSVMENVEMGMVLVMLVITLYVMPTAFPAFHIRWRNL